MIVMFERYPVLALVGDWPYTVALLRDPDEARDRYLTADRCAAAMYKNADTLTLVVEQARATGLTGPGSERELARRPLQRSQLQVAGGQVQPTGAARRRHRRRRTVPAGQHGRGVPAA